MQQKQKNHIQNKIYTTYNTEEKYSFWNTAPVYTDIVAVVSADRTKCLIWSQI